MRWLRLATYLWPGLPQLWFEASWSGLALAVGFSFLLNLLLVASLVWTQLLEPAVLRFGWLALGIAWVGSLIVMGWGRRASSPARSTASQEDLFRRALAEYLRGAWFEAESLWAQLADGNPRDLDSRLMLATLWRRTRRLVEARQQLAELERWDDAARWRAEIEQEKQLLTELQSQPVAELSAGAAEAVGTLAQAA